MEFYVYLNGARRGPLTEDKVQSLLTDGLLLPTDLAAADTASDWKPLAEFQRFVAAMPEAPVQPVIQPSAKPSTAPKIALGPYARTTLAPDEVACYQTSLHWIIFARFAGAGLALLVFAAVPFAIAVQAFLGSELGWFVLPLPVFLLVPPAVAFASSEILITDRRVLIKTGIVRRETAEMFLSKVESIAVEQGFLGRLLDYGTVRIRGTGGFEEGFDSIARPLVFREWVQRLQQHGTPTTGR